MMRRDMHNRTAHKYMKLSRGTARRAMLVNSCYVFEVWKLLKGFKQQKWPPRSFKGIDNGAIRQATYDFLLDFPCNHVSYLAMFPRYYHLLPMWVIMSGGLA